MTASAPVKLQNRAKRNARKRDEKKALIAESALRASRRINRRLRHESDRETLARDLRRVLEKLL